MQDLVYLLETKGSLVCIMYNIYPVYIIHTNQYGIIELQVARDHDITVVFGVMQTTMTRGTHDYRYRTNSKRCYHVLMDLLYLWKTVPYIK